MTLNLLIAKLPVPELEFAGSGYYVDPRRGLTEAGPLDLRFGSAHRSQVRIAITGTPEIIAQALTWFERCKSEIQPTGNVLTFPGFANVYRSELVIETCPPLDQSRLNEAMSLKPYECFAQIVQIYADAIRDAKQERCPDVVVCCIPESIEKKYWSVQRLLSREERRLAKQIAKQSSKLQLELPFDWETEEEPEDLLRRDLRRALKAEAMRIGIPIQLVLSNTFIDLHTNEEAAVRAWNISVGLYYKAGGIPWRIRTLGPETCYVGITFHHLRTNKRALVYSGLAQAFSSSGEGFALKGSTLEPDSDNKRTPHLTVEQALQLGRRVLQEYDLRSGGFPKRVVLHKSSRFWHEEQEGFRQAFRDVPVLQMVALAPSSIRLVTHAIYPPSRGTLLTIENVRHFLFTSGYMRELGTYPGPHIPVPVEIIMHGEHNDSDLRQAAGEILALGRLNWNTTDLRSSQPVTLGFARRVGGIMAEYGLSEDRDPDPNYRYYM